MRKEIIYVPHKLRLQDQQSSHHITANKWPRIVEPNERVECVRLRTIYLADEQEKDLGRQRRDYKDTIIMAYYQACDDTIIF